MSTTILGLNMYHADSSACLLVDGRLIAAAEEERFRRIKHWSGFPIQAIRYCLSEGGTTLAGLDHIAVNRKPAANLGQRLLFTLGHWPRPSTIRDRLSNARAWQSIERELASSFPDDPFRGKVHHVEHHLAHVASAFWCSPFESAVALSIDGFGDFASAGWGLATDGELKIDGCVYFPHSLGLYYQAMTQFLGFTTYGDEYKVMGLAPYGEPQYLDELHELVRLQPDGTYRLNLDYFRHQRDQLSYTWRNCAPQIDAVYSAKLLELLGRPREPGGPITRRDRDLARSIQEVFESALFHLLGTLHDRYQDDRLVLAGGCALNSVANGKLLARSPFKHVYVPPAAGDAGGAVGAAATVSRQVDERRPCGYLDNAAWGPCFDLAELGRRVEARSAELSDEGCLVERMDDDLLLTATARAIADGSVIGWFQDRMEWGPRALGNRSILCDPRRADMKDVLNRKIKRRESFRPFAPSVLRENVADWFETDDDVPFMEKVYRVREDRREQIPAVTHVDGTGRLQTVDRSAAPRYHELISRFHEITGVPAVLNTSFNEREPIVCDPDEAIDCFLRTDMDWLVLDRLRITRARSASPQPPNA
jgi:carbamoyltransferase